MKRFYRALCLLLCLSVLLCAAAPAALAADDTGADLRFDKRGKLKIAVFSDVQTTQLVSQNLIDGLAAVLDAEQPDLVVYLGDQVEGKHPFVHLGDNEAHVKRVIDQVLAPTVERGIPFAVVFGNHDASDSGVSKETQMAYYQSFPGCLAVDEGSTLPGCGTYHLICQSSDGKRPALNLYFVDSMEYDPLGGYGCVTKEQTAWCRTVSETLARAAGGPVPAVLFQHIVVPEVYNAFTRVRNRNEAGAFAGQGVGDGGWYTAPSGLAGLEEAPCPPRYSNGQFAAWRESGDVRAAFFGHDHVNSYTVTLDGIDLVACPGATFASYNREDTRGVRIIEIDENDILEGVYETHVVLLRDLYEPGFFAAVRRFFAMSRIWDFTLLGVILVFVLANAVFWPVFVHRRKKKKRAAAVIVEDAAPARLPQHTGSGRE